MTWASFNQDKRPVATTRYIAVAERIYLMFNVDSNPTPATPHPDASIASVLQLETTQQGYMGKRRS